MKVIGLIVCGVGETERYLKKTLECFKKLCDDVVVCCNGEDEKRDRLLKKYNFWFYRDDREWGRNQWRIKTDLLARIAKLKPDWILPLDADEEILITRQELESLTDGKRGCYFYIVDHWNDEGHYHRGLSFWNVRFFKLIPSLGLTYLRQPLHCGLAPPYAYFYGSYVPFMVRHYGIMTKEDRMKKVERYQKYDPEGIYKPSYYEALKRDPKVATFDEGFLKRSIEEEISKKNQKVYKD